jgi:branched-chain amino acid transport system permease protein
MIARRCPAVYPNMGSAGADHLLRGGGHRRHRLGPGALAPALLIGLVDTFGKVLLPEVAGMLVYMLMAAVLLWKPEGLFKQ